MFNECYVSLKQSKHSRIMKVYLKLHKFLWHVNQTENHYTNGKDLTTP